jgi:hypothetical protein
MVLLDFSKAFDTVPHTKLIALLSFYQIHPAVVKWIESLLSARTQQTCVDDHLSKSTKVLSGAPQGSVIGLLLFNIYINGLLLKIQTIPNVFVLAFADDLKLISSDYSSLQEALLYVEQWCELFKLKLNPSKSEHMCFKRKQDRTFWICSESIKKVDTTKDLGVILTSSLKWQPNTAKITSKATSITFLILRAFGTHCIEPYILAYQTYVRPILEYNTVVWNSINPEEVRKIEKVQKLFTRKLLQRLNIKYDNYKDRLRILNLETLELRRLHYDLITIYKIMNNLVDTNTSKLFVPHTKIYNFRHLDHHVTLKKPTTARRNTLLKSFTHRIINAWNSISKTLLKPNLSPFSKKL